MFLVIRLRSGPEWDPPARSRSSPAGASTRLSWTASSTRGHRPGRPARRRAPRRARGRGRVRGGRERDARPGPVDRQPPRHRRRGAVDDPARRTLGAAGARHPVHRRERQREDRLPRRRVGLARRRQAARGLEGGERLRGVRPERPGDRQGRVNEARCCCSQTTSSPLLPLASVGQPGSGSATGAGRGARRAPSTSHSRRRLPGPPRQPARAVGRPERAEALQVRRRRRCRRSGRAARSACRRCGCAASVCALTASTVPPIVLPVDLRQVRLRAARAEEDRVRQARVVVDVRERRQADRVGRARSRRAARRCTAAPAAYLPS